MDLKWLSTPHAELECAIIVLHVGLRIARMKEPILVDNHAGLDKGQRQRINSDAEDEDGKYD